MARWTWGESLEIGEVVLVGDFGPMEAKGSATSQNGSAEAPHPCKWDPKTTHQGDALSRTVAE